jgi:hypothetical protein
MQKKAQQLKIAPFSTLPSLTPVILHCLVTLTAFSQKHVMADNTITNVAISINY